MNILLLGSGGREHALAWKMAASPLAATAFASLSKTSQYAVILDVVTARTPTTRKAHIDKAIAELKARGD